MWLSKGMFLDGLIYASISRNLSLNLGNYWDLQYTFFTDSHFMSHPPLVFWIQNFLFKIFGDLFYLEKIYSVFVYFISGIMVVKIWRLITEPKDKDKSWLPLLLWIIIPVVTWSAVNNLLENTMMFFDLLSILFIFRSIQKNNVLNIIFASLSIFAAFMCKGLPALFPLSAYFFIWVTTKQINFKKMTAYSFLILSLSFSFFMILIFSNAKAYNFFEIYFHKQIIGTINLQIKSKWYSLFFNLLEQLIIPLVAVIVMYIISKKTKKISLKINYKKSLLFLLIALSGVLPIMLSPKQRTFYLIPTLPLFAISIALFIDNFSAVFYKKILNKYSYKIITIITIFLFWIALIVSILNFGKVNRDKELIEDIGKIETVIGKNSHISISNEIYNKWSMHAYFQRYHKISLSTTKELHYKLVSSTDSTKYQNYTDINLELHDFKLLKHN